MSALEHAFYLLEQSFEEEFKIAYKMSDPASYLELEEHRAFLYEKWKEYREFFRDHWKNVFEKKLIVNDGRIELALKELEDISAHERAKEEKDIVSSDHGYRCGRADMAKSILADMKIILENKKEVVPKKKKQTNGGKKVITH